MKHIKVDGWGWATDVELDAEPLDGDLDAARDRVDLAHAVKHDVDCRLWINDVTAASSQRRA